MKIECTTEKLDKSIGTVSRFIGKNELLPVLSCIFLEGGENTMTLRATNLDVGIEIIIPAKVEQKGSLAIPGSVFRSFLSGIVNEKKVVLEKIHENLSITTSRNTTLIKGYNTEDFPTIPRVHENEFLEIHAEVLRKGIESVWYSASTSPIKPDISSVYIYQEGQELVFVATDSFRLAEKRLPLKIKENFLPVILPYRNILEIMKVLEGVDGPLRVNFGKNQISFETNSVYLTSRVVDGVFPDYGQIIPKAFVTEVVVLKNDLLKAVKVTNIFSDKFLKIFFKISVKEKRFEVEARNADIGENTTRIDAKISGEDISLSFNYRYILDVFSSIPEDSLSLEFSGEGRPLIIHGVGDNTFTYLVMPMNK